MDIKEVEEKLKQKAQEGTPPPFEQVWKGAPQPTKTISFWKKWFRPLVLATAGVAVACAIVLPIALRKPNAPANTDIYYQDDGLVRTAVEETVFLEAVKNSTIQIVDLTRFQLNSCATYETDKSILKGGKTEFLDSQEQPTCMINLKFYNYDVQVDEQEQIYDTYYTTQTGANIEYVYDTEISQYIIKAEYKKVQYFMEYTGVNEMLTQFFENFFQ